jgi:hypothetical protein
MRQSSLRTTPLKHGGLKKKSRALEEGHHFTPSVPRGYSTALRMLDVAQHQYYFEKPASSANLAAICKASTLLSPSVSIPATKMSESGL